MRLRRFAVAAIVGSLLAPALVFAQPAPQISRGPYLQVGTPTSIVVRWRTTAATDTVVDYGPDPANLIFSASAAAPTIDHEIELPLLQPATKYYYAVGSTAARLAGGDATHFFVTSPPAGAATPTRIWVLGDSGTADLKAETVRDAYYGFAGSTFTNLWLMLGDNAYNDGLDSEYQRAVFDMYPLTLRQSVLWPTKGNHDHDTSTPGDAPYFDIFTLPKNAQAGGVASGTEAYYSFDYGNIHFICLNSFDVDRSPGAPMLTWLQADLAATTARWIIAYWHHPPYSKGSHDSDIDFELTEMRQNVLPILEAGGADLVLSGHSHSYERSFLIDGHYGRSDTFTPGMKLDSGDGRESGAGAYRKVSASPVPHAGTVYAVAGVSGNTGGGTLDHPAMFVSMSVLGSLALDVNGGRLDVRFVDDHSVVRDSFTILKDPVTPPAVVPDVVGLTEAAATTAIEGATLTRGVVTSAPHPSIPSGSVISQDPAAGSQVPAGSPVNLVVSSGPAIIAVPDLVDLTQAGASAAIAQAGLTQGLISSLPSALVPAGRVISQSPAAGSQVAAGSAVSFVVSAGISVPVKIGSQIAGTFGDATGHSGQSHLFYAANAGVWWLLTLTSGADSPGGTNHLVKAYRSSGPDLASATWTAAASSPGASAAASVNCGSCTMAGGRSLGVAYINNAPTDVVHAEVAMAFNGQNGLTAHIRATVSATAIAWESWSYYDAPAATWTVPRGNVLGVSTGKFIHTGGPTLQQEVDANIRLSTNADTGASWTSGFSAVSLVDNSMFHESNSMAFAPLAANRMLAVYDNGGGQSGCFNCSGGVPEPNLSNLGYKRSNTNGSWPSVPVGGQGPGDGKVFAADATIDHNDWALVSADTSTIYAFRRNAAGSGVDAAVYNVAANSWSAFAAPPLFGPGQSHKARSGLFGVSAASALWLFVINTDAANSILYTRYQNSAWSAWAALPGTDTGTHVRNFIAGHPVAAASQIGLVWTEGTTQFDIVATSLPLTSSVPDVVGLTQATATSALASAGFAAGTVTGEASASVAPGLVVTQTPSAGTAAAFGTTVNLAISLGPNPTTVPDVVNATQSNATTTIAAAGLAVGSISQASSTSVASGSVISQQPPAGTLVPANSAVNLVVSTGPPPVITPNVVNQTLAAATASLQAAGLAVGSTSNASSTSVAAGNVISQNPAAGTQVTSGSTVALVISTGPPLVAVPAVVGMTQAAATSAITASGLVVGAVTMDSSTTEAAGIVVSQAPVGGVQAAVGSAVALTVSSGPPPAPIVDQVVFSDGNGTRTTASFSTAVANELLLAFVASDGPAGAGGQTLTVSGAGLTWTLIRRANTQTGSAEVWQAKAAARLVNVTVKSTQAKPNFRQSLTVVSFRDASGTGATSIASAATGAPAVTLVTTKPNALVYGVGNDADRAVARTLGAGQTMVHQSVVTASADTFWAQRRSAAATAAGSSVTINCTAPTNDRWNLVGVEIVP